METTAHALHFLCRAEEVAANTSRRVDIPGFPALAVFNLDGSFFITDDRCTHGEASLCEGEIDGDLVECPFHQGTFDIRTGKPTGAPCRIALRTYEVAVEQGGVHIRQPE
ncbi:non-heme iron oxygenase ferredoxin subunit [Cupriavidus necator]|uniref:non-heme iron oxygenase ferredoxin subunit n=1 Tax=Cupriavidus necator TaxID=106590 RepID=UPI003ECF5CF0